MVFVKGSLPFAYVGIMIFKEMFTTRYLKHLTNIIFAKLYALKISLLSISDRVLLLKPIIQGKLTHSIFVYACPTSLLKSIEDTIKIKLVIVAWKKPHSYGGLGLRSLVCSNKTSNWKLNLDLMKNDYPCANLLKGRVLRKFGTIMHHIFILILV